MTGTQFLAVKYARENESKDSEIVLVHSYFKEVLNNYRTSGRNSDTNRKIHL